MKIKDEIKNASNNKIDQKFIAEVEKVYMCKLPEMVKHILCIPDSPDGYEERPHSMHKLQNDMILEASEEMSCDFVAHHLLPVFDMFDNDYICYDYANNMWCMFNIVDELAFNEQKELLDLF